MPYDPQRHHRRSIRLAGHDYSAPQVSFVTICTQTRGATLGTVRAGAVALNEGGTIARDYWLALPTRYAAVTLDAWVVMPDHLHGLLILGPAGATPGADPGVMGGDRAAPGGDRAAPGGDHVGSPLRCYDRVTIGDIVGWFKTMTTNAYIRGVRERGWPPFNGRFWQRNYYERIVRTDAALDRVRTYIAQNPAKYRGPP